LLVVFAAKRCTENVATWEGAKSRVDQLATDTY
jgi:hypothetical protein